MGIELSESQYGKAETRVVRIYRDTDRHEIRDLNVSTALRGDFDAAHLAGDQAKVLPTDSQKNTCFAYAKEHGDGTIEDYALALAEHFVTDIPSVRRARVDVDEYRWERVQVGGTGHAHTFMRAGHEVRTVAVTFEAPSNLSPSNPSISDSPTSDIPTCDIPTCDNPTCDNPTCDNPISDNPISDYRISGYPWIISGIKDLVVLKSTGSEFAGFYKDRYTTLAETTDRILATSLTARWRYGSAAGVRWDEAFGQIRQLLLERFAQVYSRALQQTLYEMGAAVLAARDDVVEVRLSAPNKHHFLVDLAPCGLENAGEVFFAADRPYGLIQCAVQREGAPPAGPAWEAPGSFA